ncbi:MAG: protein-L-isoaspartate O-methyltransferase [Acetobacteraceae bacterium]|nr:protein-L-isoaspartate O-methyltransferase [Acetobacteraceae bacterium]
MTLPSTATAAMDFADARNRMVDSQIRPNKVTDGRILNAMREIPRELFVPGNVIARVYTDEDVPLGDGRALMEPMVLAKLLQLAQPRPGQRALVVAAGPGYGAAVLAACGLSVVALESSESLLALARTALKATAPSVKMVSGPLADGWAQDAPYDLILIEGAVRDIPPALGPQLAPQGRLVTVRTGHGSLGKGVIAELTPAGFHAHAAFDCATPVLTELLPRPRFVF